MLASVAAHYGRGPVVAIDPHTGPSPTDRVLKVTTTTFDEFQASLKSAGVEKQIEAHGSFLAWWRGIGSGQSACCGSIGDHTYRGAKEDLICSRRICEGRGGGDPRYVECFRRTDRVFVRKSCGLTGMGRRAWCSPRPGGSSGRRMGKSFEICEIELSGARGGCCRS